MPEAPTRTWLPSWLLVPGLLLPAMLLMLEPLRGPFADLLLLSRDEVFAGQMWRIYTGHWVHMTPQHLVWDAMAFLVLGLLCDRSNRRAFLLTLSLSVVTISVTVLIARPDIRFYGGLSGIDSALFSLLACTMLARNLDARNHTGIALAAALLGAFVLKTGFELHTARTVFVPAVESVSPLPIAHVAGFVAGAAGAVLGQLFRRDQMPPVDVTPGRGAAMVTAAR